MTVLQDDALRPERGGRAEDGADVLGVGNLIEHHQHAGSLCADVVDGQRLGRIDLERQPLMHRPGGQLTGDVVGVEDLQPFAAFELAGPIGGGQQSFDLTARRIGQRGLDRMDAPHPVPGVGFGSSAGAAVEALSTPCAGGIPTHFAVVAFVFRRHYKTRSFWGPEALRTARSA